MVTSDDAGSRSQAVTYAPSCPGNHASRAALPALRPPLLVLGPFSAGLLYAIVRQTKNGRETARDGH